MEDGGMTSQAEPARSQVTPDDGYLPELAGGPDGAEVMLRLVGAALQAVAEGERERGGPLPAGGPATADEAWAEVAKLSARLLPRTGLGAERSLRAVSRFIARGAANPAHPRCAAHLHAPPLAVAAAADLVASVLNPSLDSWDQAPSASRLEAEVTAVLARLVFAGEASPDALVTTGGTESNLLGLLLAREQARALGAGTVQVICGANAHHSIARAAWTLGLPAPVVVPGSEVRLDPAGARAAASAAQRPLLLVATAGTTDTGVIDPLPELASVAGEHRAWFHVDGAYGGPALFSDRLRPLLDGIGRADSVSIDFHKFGWQPLPAGLLAVRDTALLAPLSHTADYLNSADDVEAGLPDLLGRSLRTSRRPDVIKLAVTMLALGQTGMATLVERCCARAEELAGLIAEHDAFRLFARPVLSTVVFRPVLADLLGEPAGNELVAMARRRLLESGAAVVGRAALAVPARTALAGDGHGTGRTGAKQVWLKLTLLNPSTSAHDMDQLLTEISQAVEQAWQDGKARLGVDTGGR
jgi:L-2,4-diaminobutyrate decarboxylase